MSNEDLLDSLLLVASDELEKLNVNSANKKSFLQEVDIFSEQNGKSKVDNSGKLTNSLLHSGDTDSSDDEDNRYFEEQKYNKYGKEIKKILEARDPEISPSFYGLPKQRISLTLTETKEPTVNSAVGAALTKTPNKNLSVSGTSKECKEINSDVFVDPIFEMRITNPLISPQLLKEKMVGREAVSFARISSQINSLSKGADWVICGVIVNKSPVKTSQKGTPFSIWTLTDLKDDIKTVSLFLFSSAYKEFWKISIGTIIGILNPNVLDRREGSKDVACLSVDNSQKVMVFGQSKDFGTCKSVRKNGERCTSVVNLNRCEFCIYHIKQEYKKCSKRSELQANFAGKGLTALRNKVLGKNEVFYAGKSYMAIPAKKSKKLEQKEQDIMNRLNGQCTLTKNTPKKRQVARQLEISHVQRKRDLDLLKKLGESDIDKQSTFSNIHSSNITLEESKTNALSIISKLKSKQGEDPVLKINEQYDFKRDLILNVDCKNSFKGKQSEGPSPEESKNNALNVIAKLEGNKKIENDTFSTPSARTKILQTPNSHPHTSIENQKDFICDSGIDRNLPHAKPMLSGFDSKIIDLSKPFTKHHIDRAKMNAIEFIQKTGPIKKANPNSTRSLSKKRILEEFEPSNVIKKSKLEENGLISDRFKKMMAATSKHLDLIEAHDNEEKEKYFNKLEVKERMEDKMATTYKVPCKAVKCLKCKYTSFSAAELCKIEKHPLKVFDALKRFFKCGNCQNRTASLEIFPTRPCSNCDGNKWERTGMGREKIVTLTNPLSIRGGEQKFINSVATDVNLDLLVPEQGT